MHQRRPIVITNATRGSATNTMSKRNPLPPPPQHQLTPKNLPVAWYTPCESPLVPPTQRHREALVTPQRPGPLHPFSSRPFCLSTSHQPSHPHPRRSPPVFTPRPQVHHFRQPPLRPSVWPTCSTSPSRTTHPNLNFSYVTTMPHFSRLATPTNRGYFILYYSATQFAQPRFHAQNALRAAT